MNNIKVNIIEGDLTVTIDSSTLQPIKMIKLEVFCEFPVPMERLHDCELIGENELEQVKNEFGEALMNAMADYYATEMP